MLGTYSNPDPHGRLEVDKIHMWISNLGMKDIGLTNTGKSRNASTKCTENLAPENVTFFALRTDDTNKKIDAWIDMYFFTFFIVNYINNFLNY
jgi:hypothetical protein